MIFLHNLKLCLKLKFLFWNISPNYNLEICLCICVCIKFLSRVIWFTDNCYYRNKIILHWCKITFTHCRYLINASRIKEDNEYKIITNKNMYLKGITEFTSPKKCCQQILHIVFIKSFYEKIYLYTIWYVPWPK